MNQTYVVSSHQLLSYGMDIYEGGSELGPQLDQPRDAHLI